MRIIVNGQEHELGEGKDHIEYRTLCKMAGKDPRTKPTVTVKNSFGQTEIKDNQQAFCTEKTVVNVSNTGDA